jgi:hypothetical protein
MSGMKATIEKAAEMLALGYTEHEIVRILHVPPSMAEELIQKAEQWNDELYVPYTEKDIDDMADYYGE